MATQQQLEQEFKVWLGDRIQTPELVDQFLNQKREEEQAVAQLQREIEQFIEEHKDEYVVCDANRKALLAVCEELGVPPTYDELEAIYPALKANGKLILKPRPAAVDPSSLPETRSGAWRNSRFVPDWNNQPAATKSHVLGQHRPGAPNDDDVTIRKSPDKMTAAEFAEACRVSKSFRAKFDG